MWCKQTSDYTILTHTYVTTQSSVMGWCMATFATTATSNTWVSHVHRPHVTEPRNWMNSSSFLFSLKPHSEEGWCCWDEETETVRDKKKSPAESLSSGWPREIFTTGQRSRSRSHSAPLCGRNACTAKFACSNVSVDYYFHVSISTRCDGESDTLEE